MENKIELNADGERFVKSFDGIIALEHWHRYYLVRELVKDKIILDIASGEGYGSHLLASVAKHVTGVDISHNAIAFSNQNYKRDNLQYIQGDCCKIPLSDNSVDVVVSFETIEHHDKHKEMLSEIKRVLSPNGVLIISSPNKHEYSDIPGYDNPYHVKELYTEEFVELLGKYFSNIDLADQRVVVGSLVVPRNSPEGFQSLVTDTAETQNINWNEGITRSIFNIAFASDSCLPRVNTTLTEFSVEKAKDIIFSDLINKNKIYDNEKEITRLEKSLNLAELERDSANERLQKIFNSKSWKLVGVFHRLINLVRGKNA
jgi:ubiquinone/menaquinone biosynthesis C-methylase UbiE